MLRLAATLGSPSHLLRPQTLATQWSSWACAHLPASNDGWAVAGTHIAARSCATSSSDGALPSATAAEQHDQAGAASTSGQPSFTDQEIADIRASIFGQPVLKADRDGRSILSRKLRGSELASWYFMPPPLPGGYNEERGYVIRRKLNKRYQEDKVAETAVAAEADTKKKKK